MISFFKYLFSPKCSHEPDMENLKQFICKKCQTKLTKINYHSGGIGVTDDYFSWSIKADLNNPESTTYHIFKSIDFKERLRIVKEKVAREKTEQLNK